MKDKSTVAFLVKAISWTLAGALLFNFGWSYVIETYKLRWMKDEIDVLAYSAIMESETQFQELSPKEYMFDEDGNLMDNYKHWVEAIETKAVSTNDTGLGTIAAFLMGVTGSLYTPLNFDLTYLDKEILNKYFSNYFNYITEIQKKGTTFGTRGVIDEMVQKAVNQEGRYDILSAKVVNITQHIIKLPNTATGESNTLTARENAIFKSVYGISINSNKYKELFPPEDGITNKDYLIAYQIDYEIEWLPYTGTTFLRLPSNTIDKWDKVNQNRVKIAGSKKKNALGYLSYGKPVKSKYTSIYCTKN